MAVEFRMKNHSIRKAATIEVWVDGEFRAAIYPTDRGLRLMSSYFKDASFTPGEPAMFEYKFADVRTEMAGLLAEGVNKAYTIAKDGRSITCLKCGMTSYNANDVRNRYCGNCEEFHEEHHGGS